MSKKKIEELEKEVEEALKDVFPPKPKLDKLDGEFGREDLNQLRDKINELVDKYNAVN